MTAFPLNDVRVFGDQYTVTKPSSAAHGNVEAVNTPPEGLVFGICASCSESCDLAGYAMSIIVWEWQNELNIYLPYSALVSAQLEAARNNNVKDVS